MTQKAEYEPDRLHMELASELASLERVVEEVEAFVGTFDMENDLAYRVVLLTSEAVTNAIEHGNQLDPSKSVTVDLFVNAAHIEVHIEDEGGGFDRRSVEDPRDSKNLFREGGRGLFLIEQMADEVHYDLGGRRIRMIFEQTT